MQMPELTRTNINGIELALYDSGGSGEPVVFVHGGMTDECYAVIQQPALTDRFRVIHYNRRGWGQSASDGLPLSIAQQAEDCLAVMRHAGVERAHLAGLSYGGTIALQFALDFPEATHSLALMEPGLPSVLAQYPEQRSAMETAISLREDGDIAGAIDAIFREITGGDFHRTFDENLPAGWLDRWTDAANTLFQHDIPALQEWEFSEEHAARIGAPVLNMRGADTRPYFNEIHETVRAWIPHARSAVVPDATHVMLQDNPTGSAELLTSFFARHPMAD